MKTLLIIAGLLISTFSFASDPTHLLDGKKLLIQYEGNHKCHIEFTDVDLNYACTGGAKATLSYRYKAVASDVAMLLLTESDGTTVTMVFNLTTLRLYTTLVQGEDKGFNEAVIKVLN